MVRLLFQPAEEGTGGAKPMIEQGCLEGIDEVYGFHNSPTVPEGEVRTIVGAMLASSTTIKIRIIG
jgi:metal-dependent amidase/aminoacylase/carboxypeptidase family protein